MPDDADVIARLRNQWSLDFVRVRRVLAAVRDDSTVTDLVGASGLPRRDVEAVLAELPPDVRSSATGVRCGGTPDPPDPAALTKQMNELAAGLPPSRWRLDHVPATAETMARRALHLAQEYELAGASVLCLGDHDLTSLAVGLVQPGVDLTVVDIDEFILDHIRDSAVELRLPLTTAWADLRLALPPSLVGTADLVFTDPPYTTEGMRLFLVRALEALRPTGHERLAFCFGTGERHLVKALEVQSMLADLRLALEAMLPGFNQYDGAEAIGARSDLYICRPTKGAKVGDASRPSRSRKRPNIYTRGPSALEASGRELPEPVRSAALAAVADDPALLVGDGWGAEAISLPEYFGRIAAWVTAARPAPFPFTGTPVINTWPDYGAAALRTLLLAAPERAVLIAPRPGRPESTVLPVAYDVADVPTGPGGDPAVLLITRHGRVPAGNAEAILRHMLLHPGAKIVNAWRDGLLVAARESGLTMTKNEARARIGVDTLQPSLRRLRVWELPLTVLAALPREVARSAAGLPH
ncbi:MAG TPA: bis-aminopropyl spermidine synthase family protein [Acidimicrobiia bacterium]|nr:bis-aminopropyl spermidine synthase family protein [Acidimicrobiia bacterium]